MSPKLVEVATRFGHVAHHVQYRQWKSRRDDALLAFIRAEDLTIATSFSPWWSWWTVLKIAHQVV